jgi:hypothetical protein
MLLELHAKPNVIYPAFSRSALHGRRQEMFETAQEARCMGFASDIASENAHTFLSL